MEKLCVLGKFSGMGKGLVFALLISCMFSVFVFQEALWDVVPTSIASFFVGHIYGVLIAAFSYLWWRFCKEHEILCEANIISCAVKPRPSGRGYKALIA